MQHRQVRTRHVEEKSGLRTTGMQKDTTMGEKISTFKTIASLCQSVKSMKEKMSNNNYNNICSEEHNGSFSLHSKV